MQLLVDAYDEPGRVLVCVRAGAGGADAEDVCQTLAGMYQRFFEQQKWKVQPVAVTEGRDGGLRSWTVRVAGRGAWALLAGEHGAHRVAHHSRFGGQGKRQTSFASVEVLPYAPDAVRALNMDDVQVTCYAGSSKGGQHANRSQTNVRMVHRPTGLSAVSQGRSLQANRKQALEVLAARVADHDRRRAAQARTGEMVSAGFGGRARSYVFTPYQLVCDDRAQFKSRRLEQILDGDLYELCVRLLVVRAQQDTDAVQR